MRVSVPLEMSYPTAVRVTDLPTSLNRSATRGSPSVKHLPPASALDRLYSYQNRRSAPLLPLLGAWPLAIYNLAARTSSGLPAQLPVGGIPPSARHRGPPRLGSSADPPRC